MEIIRPGTTFDFIGLRKVTAALSLAAVIASLLAYLFLAKFGVDFTGGTEIHVRFEEPIDIANVRRAVSSLGLSDDSVQAYGGPDSGEFLVRVQHINYGAEESFQEIKRILEEEYGAEAFSDWIFDPDKDLKMSVVPVERMSPLEVEQLLIARGALPAPEADGEPVLPADDAAAAGDDSAAGDDDSAAGDDDSAAAVVNRGPEEPMETEWVVRDARYTNGLTIALPGITNRIEELFASSEVLTDTPFEIVQVDSIGEKVGSQLRTQGMLSLLVTMGLILVYIAFRFELSFAPGAVIAVFHDVMVVVGVFTIAGLFLGLEFNLPVIGALLTIVGYSLNDTIVVYDRIRENLRRYRRKDLSWIINISINECLSRTLLTSLTTFLVMVMMAIFGGPILRGFAVALLAGIVVGTYSSIFVASPLIVILQRWLPIQIKPAS